MYHAPPTSLALCEGAKDFRKLQETLMYNEMLAAAPIMQVKCAQSSAAGDAYVTLTVQPLVENAVKHGVQKSKKAVPLPFTRLKAPIVAQFPL